MLSMIDYILRVFLASVLLRSGCISTVLRQVAAQYWCRQHVLCCACEDPSYSSLFQDCASQSCSLSSEASELPAYMVSYCSNNCATASTSRPAPIASSTSQVSIVITTRSSSIPPSSSSSLSFVSSTTETSRTSSLQTTPLKQIETSTGPNHNATSSPTTVSTDNNSGKLSGGSIAGIVVGALVGVIAIFGTGWYLGFRRKGNDQTQMPASKIASYEDEKELGGAPVSELHNVDRTRELGGVPVAELPYGDKEKQRNSGAIELPAPSEESS